MQNEVAVIDVSTNIGCKNACIYCASHKAAIEYAKRSHEFQMSFNTFKTCIDKVPTNVTIHFAGMSESWLNPECTKMVLYAHQKGHNIRVLTTLVGMNISNIDLLERVPFLQFLVHLPSDENYEKIVVNDNYLKILERLSKSNIKTKYMIVAGTVHHKIKELFADVVRPLLNIKIPFSDTMTLGGNVHIPRRPLINKSRPLINKIGIIGCVWNCSLNSLLPNGDVVLCCMDFGLRHTLGNLLESDYYSLFQSDEFLRVRKGLRDKSIDILCRHCEMARNIGISAKLLNPFIYHLKEIHSSRDIVKNCERILIMLSPERRAK